MPKFLINYSRNQYIKLAYGICKLYYIRQVSRFWDINNDTLYYVILSEPPYHLESVGKFIDIYN